MSPANSANDQAERLGEDFLPREASFLSKLALPPRQSAHGLCILRRVTDAPKHDDDSVVVAIPVYKGVNKAAPSKADNEACHFGDKETV